MSSNFDSFTMQKNNYTLVKNSKLSTSFANYSREGILNMKKQKILEWIKNYRETNNITPKITIDNIDAKDEVNHSSKVLEIEYEVGKNPKEYLPKFPKQKFNLTLSGKYCVVKNNFKNNSYIESIKFPDSVFRISSFAFYNCVNLKYVYLGKNVSIIYDTAFKSFSDIYFEVSNENKAFSSIGGMLFNKNYTRLLHGPFHLLKSKNYRVPTRPDKLLWDHITSFGGHVLTNYAHADDIELPPNIVVLKDCAFELFSTNGTLRLPKKLITISKYLFKTLSSNATNGKHPTVYIPKTVTTIKETAFDFFYGKIQLDKSNKRFTLKDNALFVNGNSGLGRSKNLTHVFGTNKILFRYISQIGINCKKYAVPFGVVRIADYAFHNSLLEEISIPSTVNSIGIGVFTCCKNLKQINFSPRISLIRFGRFIFYKNRSIDNCIEIISSPLYKHWKDDAFGNIILSSGSPTMNKYNLNVGVAPDVRLCSNRNNISKYEYYDYKLSTKDFYVNYNGEDDGAFNIIKLTVSNSKNIVKKIFNLNDVEIDEKSALYKNTLSTYNYAVKCLTSNQLDAPTTETLAMKSTIIFLATNYAKNNLKIQDPSKDYSVKNSHALIAAISAAARSVTVRSTNEDSTPIILYNIAYEAAYNLYKTAPTFIKTNNSILNVKKERIHYSFFNGNDSLKKCMVALINKSINTSTVNKNTIRINLKYGYSSTRDKPNHESMLIACNLILNVAKETGSTVSGVVSLPNRSLMKNFYANYHIDRKDRINNGKKLVGRQKRTFYIINPPESLVDKLTKMIYNRQFYQKINSRFGSRKKAEHVFGRFKIVSNIIKKYNFDKLPYIVLEFKGLTRKEEVLIQARIKGKGAHAVHGSLYEHQSNKVNDDAIRLLNSKWVDKQTRDLVIQENFDKRLIDIRNPTPETINALKNLDLPPNVDVTVKYF